MPTSAADVIGFAFRHATEQLFRPFRLGQWARLALVGFLAGEMGSGGSCNFRYPLNTRHQESQQAFLAANLPPQLTSHPALFTGMVVVLVVIGLGLLVLFTYIASVMRFILFDSVIARECHIRQGWSRRKKPGLRLFWWQLVFMLAGFAALLIVIVIPLACAGALGWFTHARDHVMGLVLGGIVLLFLLLTLVAFLAMIEVMTKDFVVPQMALEDISAMEGWRRLWLWLKADKGGYAGYIAMKIVLAIGAAIVVIIVDLIALFVLLIPFGGVGIIAVLGGKAAGWTWNLYAITLAVTLGCIALAILTFVFSLISVPLIVFFPAYSMYFFAPRYPPLASLLWPPASAPATPG